MARHSMAVSQMKPSFLWTHLPSSSPSSTPPTTAITAATDAETGDKVTITRRSPVPQPPSKDDHCDRRRPHKDDDFRPAANMAPSFYGKTVTPFLREHIPGLYAPIGKPETQAFQGSRRERDPNSKFCYRHRPDAKCRRAADEKKMVNIQRVRVSPCS